MQWDKKDKDAKFFQYIAKQNIVVVRPTILKPFSPTSKQDDKGLRCWHNFSLITQTGYLHTLGKYLILPVVKEVLTTVL